MAPVNVPANSAAAAVSTTGDHLDRYGRAGLDFYGTCTVRISISGVPAHICIDYTLSTLIACTACHISCSQIGTDSGQLTRPFKCIASLFPLCIQGQICRSLIACSCCVSRSGSVCLGIPSSKGVVGPREAVSPYRSGIPVGEAGRCGGSSGSSITVISYFVNYHAPKSTWLATPL